jgi:hypothetical protein
VQLRSISTAGATDLPQQPLADPCRSYPADWLPEGATARASLGGAEDQGSMSPQGRRFEHITPQTNQSLPRTLVASLPLLRGFNLHRCGPNCTSHRCLRPCRSPANAGPWVRYWAQPPRKSQRASQSESPPGPPFSAHSSLCGTGDIVWSGITARMAVLASQRPRCGGHGLSPTYDIGVSISYGLD